MFLLQVASIRFLCFNCLKPSLLPSCVQNGNYAIMHASESGQMSVVKILLEAGADEDKYAKDGVKMLASVYL